MTETIKKSKKTTNGVTKKPNRRSLAKKVGVAAAVTAAAAAATHYALKRKSKSEPEPELEEEDEKIEVFESPLKPSNPLPDDDEHFDEKTLEIARDKYQSDTQGVIDSKPYELFEKTVYGENKNPYLVNFFEELLREDPKDEDYKLFQRRFNKEILKVFDKMKLENYDKNEMKKYLQILEKVANKRYQKNPSKGGGGKSRKNEVKKTVKKSVKKL